MGPIERLSGLLREEEIGAAEVLAGSLSAKPCELPHVVRCLEDIAMIRRFEELTGLGESSRHAIRRTAKEMHMNSETVRSRIKRLTAARNGKRTGHRRHRPGHRTRGGGTGILRRTCGTPDLPTVGGTTGRVAGRLPTRTGDQQRRPVAQHAQHLVPGCRRSRTGHTARPGRARGLRRVRLRKRITGAVARVAGHGTRH